MRLPFLKPKSDTGGTARPAPGSEDPSALQLARTRARRRLMGAVFLLVVAVVAFPLLFETQPRPLPNKNGSTGPTLVVKGENTGRAAAPEAPGARSAAPEVPAPPTGASSPERAAVAAAPAARASVPSLGTAPAAGAAPLSTPAPTLAPTPAPTPASAPAMAAVAAPTSNAKPAAPPAAKASAAAATNARAPAKAASAAAPSAPAVAAAKPAKAPVAEAAASAPAGEATVRWVVQVGAYNDMERMRAARQKVEKLGFKTYITDVDTPTGKRTRVRLGPFATKKEAEDAAVKLKAAGMAANVLSV